MNCLRYNFLLLMHSALTPSLPAACREEEQSVSVCVCSCILGGWGGGGGGGKGLLGEKEGLSGAGVDFCPPTC